MPSLDAQWDVGKNVSPDLNLKVATSPILVAPSPDRRDNPSTATQPIAGPLISVEEYLNSDYEPDCEFNDGVVEERNLGEFDHSFLQAMLVTLFNNHMADWAILPCLSSASDSIPSAIEFLTWP